MIYRGKREIEILRGTIRRLAVNTKTLTAAKRALGMAGRKTKFHEMKLCDSKSQRLQNLFDFDFKHWREIGIVEMEFENIKECDSECVEQAFTLVFNEMVKTRQSQLRY